MNEVSVIENLRNNFRWRTMEGDVLTLDEMDTKHLFNSLKMIYNHLAARHGKETVWFNNIYSDYLDAAVVIPEKLALDIIVFYQEIENRNDLPEKYWEAYEKIIEQLQTWGIKKISSQKERKESVIL